MKKIISLLILALLALPSNGFSQVCGEGILTFSIYTLNGEKDRDFRYEIFPVSIEQLKKFNEDGLKRDPNHSGSTRLAYTGTIIGKLYADQLIEKNDKELNTKLQKLLEASKVPKSGKIRAQLNFKTRENQHFPIVLCITHKGKDIYILGNYFGHCDREACLMWGNNGIRLF